MQVKLLRPRLMRAEMSSISSLICLADGGVRHHNVSGVLRGNILPVTTCCRAREVVLTYDRRLQVSTIDESSRQAGYFPVAASIRI